MRSVTFRIIRRIFKVICRVPHDNCTNLAKGLDLLLCPLLQWQIPMHVRQRNGTTTWTLEDALGCASRDTECCLPQTYVHCHTPLGRIGLPSPVRESIR